MTTTSLTLSLSPPPAPAVRPASPLLRWGAVGLLLGGPLSWVFSVLWALGHGPGVVNEHGVVLGLTNDQWSHLTVVWMAPVALGAVAVCALHRGRLVTWARRLVVVGLLASWLATWVFVLYSVGLLALFTGVLCLAVAVLRGGVLPRWSGYALLLSVAAFVPVVVANSAVIEPSVQVGDLVIGGEEVIAVVTAAAWTALGAALARVLRRPDRA